MNQSRLSNSRLSNSRLSYSIRRQFVDEFLSQNVGAFSTGGLVLDVGGHKVNKRGQFVAEDHSFRTIYLNLTTEKSPDIQADAAYTPCADATFDAIICSELLEHVPEPRAIVDEMYRILKPTGVLLITVPFLYPIHGDPHDFGRYTDTYWKNALTGAGFTEFQIEFQGLFFAVCANYLKLLLNRKTPRLLRFPAQLIATIGQGGARWLEQRAAIQRDSFMRSFTTGFGIVARKTPAA